MPPALTVGPFNHAALNTRDLAASVRFYVEVLDFEVVKDVPLGDAMHFRWLRNGNQGIELVHIADLPVLG